MNKENYMHYDLLKNEVETIEKQLINFCNQYLYPGKAIFYKRGNMSYAVAAKIIWFRIDNNKWITLMVENLNTGKRRKISIDDIILY